MSCWRPVRGQDDGRMHVVPTTRAGAIVGGHTCTLTCFCRPFVDIEDEGTVLHVDPERGGARYIEDLH